jgi:uncharacterized protein YdeI (YjbR/CyaY-like superfamily)
MVCTEEEFAPKNRKEWRDWLLKNHGEKKSIWLIIYQKHSPAFNLNYQEALDEALCFGWIDGTSKKKSENARKQYFTERKPTSVWSARNKKRFEELATMGLITDNGFKIIELNKQTGSYYKLDELEQLIPPSDLQEMFDKNPTALAKYNSLCRTKKQQILYQLVFLKREENRRLKINKIIGELS